MQGLFWLPALLVPTIPSLQICSFMIRSAFVSISINVTTRWLKLLCLGLSLKLFFKRVWVTQRLLCISPRVILYKTPRTSKKKFAIGRFISSILNPSSLILTELQKSLSSIGFFKKGVSLSLRFRWSNVSSYALNSLLPRLYTKRKNIPLRYLSEIIYLLKYVVGIFAHQNKWQTSWAISEMQLMLYFYVVVSLIINIG